MLPHATRRGFATIAQCFGTAALPVIIAHLHRGILRAIALQRLLPQRAERGRDLVILTPRAHAGRAAPPGRCPVADSEPIATTTGT